MTVLQAWKKHLNSQIHASTSVA